MSRNVWFTSDTHFGHENVIKAASRPFPNVTEMCEAMVDRHNSVVGKDDLLWHLGDFAWTLSAAKAWRPKLNGTIRLIVGNHDEVLKLAQTGMFQRIEMWHQFREFGFTASHIPLFPNQIRHGFVSVHGHLHDRMSPSWSQINVCVETRNYTPVHLEDLRVEVARVQTIGRALGFEWEPPPKK